MPICASFRKIKGAGTRSSCNDHLTTLKRLFCNNFLKAEIKRRENVRFDHCMESQHSNEKRTISHVCKCGGKWSNGMTGFKSHETTSQTHLHHFPPDTYWTALYDVMPPSQIELNGAAANPHVAANAAAPARVAREIRDPPVSVGVHNGLVLPPGFEAVLQQN